MTKQKYYDIFLIYDLFINVISHFELKFTYMKMNCYI
jgi:hypothetical protein